MSEPFLGELRLISFNFAPKGWALCNGQTLAINQNQALFSLLGTFYGGNGQTTFSLPNLQGRAPIHFGNGFNPGQTGGETTHQLTASEMPSHAHAVSAYPTPTTGDPNGAAWAQSTQTAYGAATNLVPMAPAAIGTGGNSQPHDNMPPYLVLNWVIALQGIFPSRN
jgi:microcystin-dependent protein